MDMRKLTIGVVALAALLAPAAIGYAQDNAAQDEYTENIPGGGGDRPSDNGGSGGGGGSLPPGTAQDFQALGADGQAAAALAETTGPGGEVGRDRGAGARGVSAGGQPASGGSATGDVVGDLVGGSGEEGGMGVALPLILGASLLGAIAFLIVRRRRGSEAGPA
jgi:hypothetical protein